MYMPIGVLITQVKYDLTTSTGVDDKETVHCEFDVTDTDIEWLSGQIDLYAFVFILLYI